MSDHYDRYNGMEKLLGTNLASLGTECISRADAIAVAKSFWYKPDIAGELEKLPPIQPKRGKWIKSGRWGRVYKCNQCGNFLDFDGVNVGRGDANFCPNCGAEMEVTE